MRYKKELVLVAIVFTIISNSCKKWDDHVALRSQDLTQTLSDAIANTAELSKFRELVTQAGLETVFQSYKTYTVWAPSNTALTTLDPAIVSNPDKLRSFILNHISNQLYFTGEAQTSKRIGMLNGKYNNFLGKKFDDATITSADKYVKNGVLHIIDKYVPVLPSLWEFINTTPVQYAQNNFIATGMNFSTFDPALAIIDSISSTTGLPIYHPGTGVVIKNSFNERVYNTRGEDRQFTYFVIADADFTVKADALKPYFNTGNVARTDSLTRWTIVKDLLLDTLYPSAASLPPVLFSKFGVPIPINTGLIISTKKLSNGIVYVLSSSLTTIASKFPQFFIQGENPSGFQSDRTANTNYRIRKDRPDTTKIYSDILVSGHGVTDYYSFYRMNEMPTMKYNVYARAVNDFQAQEVFQSVGLFSFVAPTTFTPIPAVPAYLPTAPRTPAQLWFPVPGIRGGVSPLPAMYRFVAPSFAAVSINTPDPAFAEIFLGSFTTTAYGTLDIRLTSGATANLPTLPVFGATGNGPIVLDYLRIVPVP